MDAIFSLPAGPRARVLERAAARIPGCLYICLWAPMTIAAPLPSSHLFCVDAWITNAAAAAGRGRARAAFDEYRRAFCGIVSGCVPGWAYKDGRPYMELTEADLTSSASLPEQLQFYHEAGTKMAVFMGFDGGEIEVGLSTSTSAPAVASHVEHSLLEELVQAAPPTVPSSSSSSLPSISIGSPEYSSFIRSMAASAAAAGAGAGVAEPSSQELQLHPAAPLPGFPVYGAHGQAPFVDSDSEVAAMTQAILAVISSSAPPPPPPPAAPSVAVPPPASASSPWPGRHRPHQRSSSSSPRRWRGAFRAYNAALSPRARPRPGAPAQRMIKTAFALMASVQMAMRQRELAEARQHEDAAAAAAGQPPAAAQQHTSSQLHHMFSERRRRERLNESFQTLRALLPPGTKKDKATVLANTTEYMNKLIADVAELEERNRRLEAQLGQGQQLLPGEAQQTSGDDDDPSERVAVAVDVTAGASTSSSTAGQPQEVSIRVTVRAECDLSEIVLAMLARIKEMGRFTVVTVDARQRSRTRAQVGITLRAMGGDNAELDETSLKEAVAKAVEDAVARPPSPELFLARLAHQF